MCKVFCYNLFRIRFTNWFRPSFQKPFIRIIFLLAFSCFFLSIFSPGQSIQLSTKIVFAQSAEKETDTKKNHRLENFLISTKDRDDWTRLMLAILKSVPAVERILSQDVSVNVRGTIDSTV